MFFEKVSQEMSSKLSTRFVIFVILSLITHLLELAASGLFCYTLSHQTDLRTPWFSLAAGLFIIPMVATQLASAVYLLRRKTETTTACEVVTAAILHVLQLGFISRHFIILKEAPLSSKRTEVVEMVIMRMSFSFTSGCTLFLMQVYLLLQNSQEQSWIWSVYVSGTVNLISVTWGVSTFRRCLLVPEFSILLISWPGTILRIIWRAGEILARIIAIGLFASLYTYYLILVISLHWFSMFVSLYMPFISTAMDWSTTGWAKKMLMYLMISFAHIFAFVNTGSENSIFRYTFYFVIFFLENATLISIWFVQSSREQFSQNHVYAYVSVIVFVSSLTSMIVYYKFFHVSAFNMPSTTPRENSHCAPCSNEETSNPHRIVAPPGVSENWQTSTEPPLSLDSELNTTVTSSSPRASHQQQLYVIENDVQKRENYHCTNITDDRRDICSLSISNNEERASSNDESDRKNYKKQDISTNYTADAGKNVTEMPDFHLSQSRPVWLPSSDSNFANQLLTCGIEHIHSSDAADSDGSSAITSCNGFTNSCRSSPLELISSPNLKNAASRRVTSLPFRCAEHSLQKSYKSDRKSSGKKNSTVLFKDIIRTNSRDSENSDITCCKYPHGNSEMVSLFDPATTVQKSEIKSADGAIPQRNHTDVHLQPHHNNHHSCQNPNINLSNEQCSSFSHTYPNDDRQPKDRGSRNNQNNSTVFKSSLAYGPCCNQNTKMTYSSNKKAQILSFIDKCTPHSQQADQYISNSRHKTVVSSNRKYRDNSMAESDRLAMEILKSTKKDQNKGTTKIDVATAFTSDPRFTIRVMTLSRDEECSPACDDSVNERNKIKPLDVGNKREENITKLCSCASKQSSNREVTTCSPASTSIVNHSKHMCSLTSSIVQDSVGERIYNRTSTSNLTKKSDEVLYENLWPIKTTEDKKSCRILTDSASDRQDKRDIYICSESEDSALPHEVLSSSAECFSASESESDVSLEIVI